jgi:phosphoribosylformimino-5-aminoimidazole carboxamide ribotide isomerase
VILYPAIDLKEGRCVRLLRGEMSAATVFNEDPAAQAKSFADAGCRWLHLVDLDGAFAGKPVNAASVEAILKVVNVPAQLGGGIRNLATIEGWLGKGIARVILGTAALTNPDLVKEGCRKFPGKVAIGIDARDGKVAVEGWAKTSEMTALDLARRVEDAGAAAIIFTDIDRDGALAGVNVTATAALAQALKTPVIASGGVAAIDDIVALKAHESDGIAGAIMGRALYDGRIDLKAALAMVG